MNRLLTGLLGLMLIITAGCGRAPQAVEPDNAIAAELDAANARITALERTNAVMNAKLASVERWFNETRRQVNALSQTGISTEKDVAQIVENVLAKRGEDRNGRSEDERAERRQQWQERAQEGQRRSRESEVDRVAEELELNDEQKEKVAESFAKGHEVIGNAFREAMEKMRAGEGFDREELMKSGTELVEKIRSQRSGDMKELLNEEQFGKYKLLEDEAVESLDRWSRMMGGGGGRGRGRGRRGGNGDRSGDRAGGDGAGEKADGEAVDGEN